MALCCKEDYETPGTFSSICDAILNVSEAGRAGVFQALQLANDSSDVRAKIYGALASLCALGPKQASVELAEYEDMLEQCKMTKEWLDQDFSSGAKFAKMEGNLAVAKIAKLDGVVVGYTVSIGKNILTFDRK